MFSAISLALRAVTAWLETKKLKTDVQLYRESKVFEKELQAQILAGANRGADNRYLALLGAELRDEAWLRDSLAKRVGFPDRG